MIADDARDVSLPRPAPVRAATWAALLMALVIVLLPVGRAAEAPVAIGALCGLVLAWRQRAALRHDRGLQLVVALFASYWLPALLSAPGSVAAGKSWSTVRDLLRFLPFAAFALLALRAPATPWSRLVQGVGAVVALWLIDAWVQAFTGFGIAGAAEKERLAGIFGAGNLKLGPVLAVLSPFVLVAAREAFGRRGLVLAFVALLVPVLLAGSRAAWLMFALVTLILLWRETRSPLRFLAAGAIAAALSLAAALLAFHDSRAFEARVDRTLLALSGSEKGLDEAGAGRVRIWSTATRMIAAHPVTGVGVRAFRYAYPAYALPGDDFVAADGDEGAAHAHQIVLEVLSETGVIGLAGWLCGALLLWRAWRRAPVSARERALAPLTALVAMTFPLDTHLAFYSAWWGLLFWWLLALCVAALFSDAGSGVRDGA